ncbi:MAG: alpha-amylase [Gemmatimonadaceae bacterium]|nr:alpha-amylase [Chitinophagaceae bacterium]
MKHSSLFAVLLLVSAGFFSCKDNSRNVDSATADSTVKAVSAVAAPEWTKQSNIYEVNVRQYTKEGTFSAFANSLPRLKTMGVDILWFMPITPISKTDRKGTLGSYYAVADYKSINPEFGTMADWKALVTNAHEQGFKVITDWVPNHTGADHPWLTTHPEFYTKDSTGKVMYAFDWSDTRDLNYSNRELRDSMIAIMKWWVDETGIDGFRCDVAGEVPTDFWRECIAALKEKKNIFMLAEGDKGDLHKAGFDASYPWEMFKCIKDIAAGIRPPAAIDSVLMKEDTSFPAGAVRMYFTSNHDENSWNKADYGTFPGLKHTAFAVLTQTLRNSLPLVYSGQEEPVLRNISFFEKDDMKFGQFKRAPFYRALLTLRKSNAALATDASFKKVKAGDEKAVYGYLREKDGKKVLVILNLSNKEQKIRVEDSACYGEPTNLFLGVKEKINETVSYNVEPWGYVVYYY